jgi:tetratricopeptide (TPR) repeat protein
VRQAIIVKPGLLVLRRAELAEAMRRPERGNFSTEPQPPCEQCQRPLAEVLITTGGPMGDPALWRDHPVAVDGWACADCGVFRYPRNLSPARITEIMKEGVEHGRADRFAEAELCFARIVWDWPGYAAGHLNYAEATRSRLHQDPPDAPQLRRQLERRMVEHYEAAIDAFVAEPTPAEAVAAIARACLTLAEHAIESRAVDRARRFLITCLRLEGLPEPLAAQAREGEEYVRTRRDLFAEAADLLSPRIRIVGRPPQPPATPQERKEMVEAIEKLDEHLALAPERWQSLWLRAKALPLLDRDAEAFETWKQAFALHPGQREIAQDYSLELLLANRASDAREVSRAHAALRPDDAQACCNLAVAELLCGDLDAAGRALRRSDELDPTDPVARTLARRLAGYRAGKPLPRTMAELERGDAG